MCLCYGCIVGWAVPSAGSHLWEWLVTAGPWPLHVVQQAREQVEASLVVATTVVASALGDSRLWVIMQGV
jgi:hypothetical protein